MADSLAALIKSTEAGREQILEYLDCELSHGDVQGGRKPWEIQSSTLPFKEGRQLELASRIQVDPVTGRLSHRGKASEGETWSFPVNTNSTQDLLVLFPQS